MNIALNSHLNSLNSNHCVLHEERRFFSGLSDITTLIKKAHLSPFLNKEFQDLFTKIGEISGTNYFNIQLGLGIYVRGLKWFGFTILEFCCPDRESFHIATLKGIDDLPRKTKKEVFKTVNDIQKSDFNETQFQEIKNFIELLVAKESYLIEREALQTTLHEIQTPIGSLRSQIELLGQSGMEMNANIHQIRMHLETMTSILNQERVFTENSFTFRNPGALINELKNRFSSSAKEKGLKITVERCNVDIKVITHRFELAVSNIISNAIKYSFKNSNKGNPNANINVGFMVQDRQLLIHFSNNGELISSEDIQSGRIFEKGKRGSSERKGQGTGFGLYIVKKIIEIEHKGRLTVISQIIDKGMAKTTITLSLPI